MEEMRRYLQSSHTDSCHKESRQESLDAVLGRSWRETTTSNASEREMLTALLTVVGTNETTVQQHNRIDEARNE